MPKICYVPKNFRAASIDLIRKCEVVIDDLQSQGYEITLRQLYYQLVSKNVVANTPTSYDNLGSLINDARLAGEIDWDALVDLTRNLQKYNHWETAKEYAADCPAWYSNDKWVGQEYRPEVWVEKDALLGIIARPCRKNDVPYFSCRGYTSQSEMHAAAMRLQEWRDEGYTPIIIHLGDHDPSGIDMSRDIESRLKLFSSEEVEVRRIALNMDQIETYSPPPNPAKLTDCRAKGYVSKFGMESWELDALEPSVIDALVQAEIDALVQAEIDDICDYEKITEREELEEKNRKSLKEHMRKMK